jgi:energy-coupling factor transport system permease protein
MLVTWRYRKRKSLIQWFDPRAWIIFYGCFLVTSLLFWDIRFLLPLVAISVIVLLTSGLKWKEIRRAFLFIVGFIFIFTFLTFLTGRGGSEVYKQEHLIREFRASFSILGWTPSLKITIERAFFAVSQFGRVFGIAIMTILIPYSLNPALYGITFRGIGLPDKIAYAMDLTMRFIPTFGRDFQLTMDAQRARGYELAGSLPRYASLGRSSSRSPSTPSLAARTSSMRWTCAPSASVRAPGWNSFTTTPGTGC